MIIILIITRIIYYPLLFYVVIHQDKSLRLKKVKIRVLCIATI